MRKVPEIINHYLSKVAGLRLITNAESEEIFTALKALQTYQKKNQFKYFTDNFEAGQRINRIYELLEPKKAQGFNKIRLGNTHDGGYITLDNINNLKAAISLGINDDVSWDIDVANRGLKIYQYDHTVEAPPVKNENFIFHKIKISSLAGYGTETIENIIKKYGITEPSSVILKIDIEGDEWDVFNECSEKTLAVFSQILCEFHNFDRLLDNVFFDRAINVFSKLKENFEVFHIHANNYAPLLLAPGAGSLPEVLEICFGNKLDFNFVDTVESFPGILDTPNNSSCPDYVIEYPHRIKTNCR